MKPIRVLFNFTRLAELLAVCLLAGCDLPSPATNDGGVGPDAGLALEDASGLQPEDASTLPPDASVVDCPPAIPDLCGSGSSAQCTSVATDPANCGACSTSDESHACPAPDNASTACSGGECGYSCVEGWLDCDELASNGCEVNSDHCASAVCKVLGLPVRAFASGPCGPHRGDVADDFTLVLTDGSSFHLKERFSGCESYVFMTDAQPVSEADPSSLWTSAADVGSFLKASPKNAQYFFVSQETADADAQASLSTLQGNLDTAMAHLTAAELAHWKERIHLIAGKASDLEGWLGDVLSTHGQLGFSIDRLQRVRGAGDLSDGTRFSQTLLDQGRWPFQRNLAFAANDPRYFNAEAILAARLEAEVATVIDLWTGDVLAEKGETTVTLPSAAEMAGFDTLEVEVTLQCPDPDKVEIGNCGAWDYIANLFLVDDPSDPVELARFITSYHRETHWVVDASDMLPRLKNGGQRNLLWSFAPSWNPQPTSTHLSLRLSNQNKGLKPSASTFLFAGGAFNADYNAGRMLVEVPIPVGARKVELFAIITGHGADSQQCAEFCNHQHEFTVNGHKHLQSFPLAGTADQCLPAMDRGMTPNQAGTWWYGRGGWCPGQQVDPWVVDVTSEVTPGQAATVSYRGLFQDAEPPADGAGNVLMVSYLVIHE
ncbi:MAG: hypothetical protein HY901_22350 [Deltaproteobacteria bacterium]|nr:hypothetical protein [Deltaproteobacteria bacterium]